MLRELSVHSKRHLLSKRRQEKVVDFINKLPVVGGVQRAGAILVRHACMAFIPAKVFEVRGKVLCFAIVLAHRDRRPCALGESFDAGVERAVLIAILFALGAFLVLANLFLFICASFGTPDISRKALNFVEFLLITTRAPARCALVLVPAL
jgi:hypothetical protein